MRNLASRPVNDVHPLNRGLSAWWLHLPGRVRGYRNQHLHSCPAAIQAFSLEAAVPATGAPSKGRGQAPPGRWGSWDFGNAALTDRVHIADGFTQLVSNQQVHTISMWVMARSFSGSPVIYSHGIADAHFFAEFTTSGYLYWSYNNTYRTYTSGQCTVGQWAHLVFSRTAAGNSGNLYVNGVLASTYTGSFGDTQTATRDLWIGNYNTAGLGLDGCIDDFRVYSTRALDASEAYQLYVEGLRGYPTLLRWRKRQVAAASTGQTIAMGLVTETDTPLAVTSRKALAFGLASETDSLLAMTARKSLAAGLVSETDTPLAMTFSKALAFGLVTETDASLAMSAVRSYAAGLVTETDTALGAASLKALAFGLVTETDSALAMSAARSYAVGLTTETDTALAMTSLKALAFGLVSEADTALTMTPLVGGQLGLVTETDSPLALTALKTLAVGLTTETDTPLAMTSLKALAFGLVTETDSALAMTFTKALAVGLVSETDTALAVTSLKALAFGLVTETDTALAMTLAGDVIAVGLVTETDSALAMTFLKARVVGLVVETDTALGLTVVGLTVAGPYTVPTAQVFLAGHAAAQAFLPGAEVAEVTQ